VPGYGPGFTTKGCPGWETVLFVDRQRWGGVESQCVVLSGKAISRNELGRSARRQEVTVLFVDRQRMSCDTTPRIAERLGARKKPRLDHVGLPEMRCRFIRDRRTIEGSRVATRCATPVRDARNRKVSGRSTSKDVAGGRAHLDHVGLVNMGQGFTREPRTIARHKAVANSDTLDGTAANGGT